MNFELGGVTIPLTAGLEFSQTYETIGGIVLHRMQSGRAVKQTHFKKLKTVVSGKGWAPTGLDCLDYSTQLWLKSAVPLSISSKFQEIILPHIARSDIGYSPKVFALVDSELIESKLVIDDRLVTLEYVDDAITYQVHYYPELLVYAEPPQVHGNVTSSEFSWSIICEEV